MLKVVFLLGLLGLGHCLALPASNGTNALHDIVTWGRVGHSAIGAIATSLLNTDAQAAVKKLLADDSYGHDLADIANWADSVRKTSAYKWSASLHFINTPDWKCTYSKSRDCIDSTYGTNFCADGAIQNYTGRLKDTSLPHQQQTEALKFLTHFIGDIHQPLHTGFTGDYGGNSQKGTFEGGSKGTLHGIWDYGIIEKRVLDDFSNSATAYQAYLLHLIRGDWSTNVTAWAKCSSTTERNNACSTEWAQEGIVYACAYSYVEADGKTHIENGFSLGDAYYKRNLPIVEQRLVQASVRLATVLNSVFS